MHHHKKSSDKDYYKILELDKSANDEQIKKAYRKLAIKWHPDKNPDDKQNAEEKFKKINEAYSVLSDPKKKQMYDQFGTTEFNESGGGMSGGIPG